MSSKLLSMLLLVGLLAAGSTVAPFGCRRAVTHSVNTTRVLPSTPPTSTDSTPAWRPRAIYSQTSYVEDLAEDTNTIWAATRGGLEAYDKSSLQLRRHYTTADGLDSLYVRRVLVAPDGTLSVDTAGQRCFKLEHLDRFRCEVAAIPAREAFSPTTQSVEGARVTRQLTSGAVVWLGTAGMGLWVREAGRLRRLTPGQQICSNHIVAITEFRANTWFASFDQGLCRSDEHGFASAPLSSRMLNDVVGTAFGLFVAANDGLYWSRDGHAFARYPAVTEKGVNDLAYDAKTKTLYATAVNSLWILPLERGRSSAVRAIYRPAGSKALQAVDVSSDGAVWLASEDRGILRWQGDRRFEIHDRASGYVSSWTLDVAALDRDHAVGASLRNGLMGIGKHNHPLPSCDDWILSVSRADALGGGLLVGTQHGGFYLSAAGQSVPLAELPDPRVHVVSVDQDGYWVGTEGGLARYPRR